MKRRSDLPLPAAAGCVLAAATLLLTACAPGPSARFDPARNRLCLDAWVTVLADPSGDVRPCVRVAAPHRSLVFRRDGEGYRSGLEVSVTAWRGEVQVGGGVGEARVAVTGYAATEAAKPLEVTVPLLVRGDEAVRLEVFARVVDSSRSWLRELSFSPRALATMPVWITGVRVLSAAAPDGDLVVEADSDSLRLEVALQRRPEATAWPATGLSLVSEVSGVVRGELASLRRPVPEDLAPGERRRVEAVWPTAGLPFGRCRLQVLVELVRDDQWMRLPHEPAMELVNLRVPLDDDEAWRRHVDWLEGTVTDARRDSLHALDRAGRSAAWAAVWRDAGAVEQLDANEAQRRHLRRIVSADDRFGGHDRGAESDRGRTLIRWGEPARVETFADARAAGAVWEVWDYPARDLRLFFFDAHGSGDFRLRRQEPLG